VPFTQDFYTVRIPVLTKRFTGKEKFPLQDMKILQFCDGTHTIEAICQKTGFSSVKVDLILREYQKKNLIKITKNMPPFVPPLVQNSSGAPPQNQESFNPPTIEVPAPNLIDQQSQYSYPPSIPSEEDAIYAILDKELPRMPEQEKAQAVREILQYTPGIPRDAWLKITLVKNKKYAKIT
jgi:hypothetical protein